MIPTSLRHVLPPIGPVQPVAGGDICRAYRAELDDGQALFIKCHDSPPPGMFLAEARGLAQINGALPCLCPEVVAVTEEGLALRWLELRPGAVGAASGRALARLHRVPQARFGGGEPNYLGTLPQQQGAHDRWADFYAEERLLPLARRCPRPLRAAVERLIPDLGSLLNTADPPSLIHGDLWGGNAGETTDGSPNLYDPAVSIGHREQDLAMTLLFGGFSPEFYAAYEELYPLSPGWRERVPLHQLYPLLAHAVLFGGSYVAQTQRIAERFAR